MKTTATEFASKIEAANIRIFDRAIASVEVSKCDTKVTLTLENVKGKAKVAVTLGRMENMPFEHLREADNWISFGSVGGFGHAHAHLKIQALALLW